ncbi:FmdB family zinc ribbon protein [Comamonas badia]|uniref:FmdB family zinc ribbon protein n=1 Tax=Comamonas badia TaxID=265291 RepID=UPI000425F42B|nr:FmdB family zinc ribbon protein [Comamonas badia]
MPIYAYRCSHCGHAQDVLQKMSDAPLTHCPACGQESYVKQLTAAGFQLKGSGWYETDFSGRKSSAPATESTPAGTPAAAPAEAAKAPDTTKTEAPAAAPASAKATSEA